MSKKIATSGYSLSTTGGSGTVIISTAASTKVKAGTLPIYRGNLTVTASAMLSQDGTCGNATGTGTIVPSATKVKSEGQFVVLENDSCTYTCTGTLVAVPHSACTFSVTTRISAAGQSKAKAT